MSKSLMMLPNNPVRRFVGSFFFGLLVLFNFSLMSHGLPQFIDFTMIGFVVVSGLLYSGARFHPESFIGDFGFGALAASFVFALMGFIVAFKSPFFGNWHQAEFGGAIASSIQYVMYGLFTWYRCLFLKSDSR